MDTRKRVVQLGAKNNTCWYAAFNLLRQRYKAPNTKNSEKRRFEKRASFLRKSLSAQDRLLPDVTNRLNDDWIKEYFKQMTKEKITTPETQKILKSLFKIF